MTKSFLSPLPRVMACCVFILACLALTTSTFAAGPAKAPAQSGASLPTPPKIWLQENRPLSVTHVGPAAASMGAAQPLSMVSADLDGDGVNDLAVGYSFGGGGFIAIHRGNLDAFAPQSDESFQAIGRGEFPSPFLLEAKTFSVPVSPDFIAVGNFTGQGNTDLVVAARGGNVLYVFAGDGKGNFTPGQTINLPGGVTTLAAGQLGTPQPLTNLIVGVSNRQQSFLAVYGNGAQGLTPLAVVPLSAPASNTLFGNFGDPGQDAAFLSGGKVSILRSSSMKVVPISLPVTVSAFALGSFLFDRNSGSQIALLASDGSVQIAVRNEFDPRVYTLQEFTAIRQARMRHQIPPLVPAPSFAANGWKIVESFPSVSAVAPGQAAVFFRTRISSNGADDIMWLSASSGQMVLIAHPDALPGALTFVPGQVSVKPYNGSPVAALPMRVNVDGRPGVIALHQGQTAPSVAMPIPDPTFTVNRTDDPTPASPITNACNGVANDCSLREAVLRANALAGTDTIMIPAGTYTLTLARIANNFTGQQGTLEVTDSVNIVGAGQATTIIQGGTLANHSDSVDKVFSFNQDISATTTASVSISNLTIQNGFNRGNTTITDGWGGAFDFDTGTGTATLTVTNVTLSNNTLTDGEGGGFAIFNTNGGAGSATFSNCIVQNNIIAPTASNGTANGGGGFVAIPASMTMTNCTVSGNQANTANTVSPLGGGLELLGQLGSPLTAIHASTISGNSAGGNGGGIYATTTLQIDQSSVIKNNTGGSGGGVNNSDGGGLWFNASNASTISKVTFTGNAANASSGNGGGIFVNGSSGGALTISFSRFAGNTAHAGTNLALKAAGAGVTAQNNWWATNSAATTLEDGGGSNPTSHCAPGAGQICFDPFIVLTHTASPNKIRINQSTTLTADMSKDNHGNGAALSGNLDEIIGLPITFNNAVDGSISGAQPNIQNNGTATATFNAGNVAGGGKADAVVDQATATANIIVLQPPSITKGFSPTVIKVGGTSTITFSITNPNVVTINSSFTDDLTSGGTVSGLVVAATPSVVNGCGGSVTANAGATSISFLNAALPVSGSACTITVNVTGTTDGIKPNSVTIDSTDAGNGNTASATPSLTVINPPTINKVFGASTIPLNGTTSLTFTITNPNSNAASVLNGIAFTDTLPNAAPGTLVVANPNGLANTCSTTPTAIAGSGSIALTGASLAAGASCTISVNVQGTVAGTAPNSVTVSDTIAGTGNTSSTSLIVVAPPTISKSFSPKSVPLNSNSTLSFTVTNPNTASALSGVAFTDTLPGGVKLASTTVTGSCGSGTITATINNPPGSPSTVSLSGGTLTASPAAGSSCTFSVSVTGISAGAQVNTTSTVSSTEGGTGGTASDTLIVVAPPTISKSFSPKSVPLNSNSTLSFTVTNPNTASALSGVAFTDTLPGGLKLASTTVTGSCGSGTITATINNPPGTPSTVSLSGGTLTASPAAGSSCTFSVSVTGISAGTQVNTTSTVSSTEGGTGGTASDTLTVIAPPTISKSFSPKTIPLNGSSTLSFTVTNPNTASALSGVAFTDSLPGGVKLASTTVTGSCGSGTITATINNPPGTPSTVSLSGGTLTASPDPASSCTFSVSVTGISAGAQVNTTGTVSSTEGGTGGTASDTLTVVAPPTISKKFGHTTVPLNQSDTLSFTLTNPNTTSALSGIAFTDTLPGGLKLASTTVTGSCGSGTITATINNPPGTPSTVSLSGGTLTASPAAGSSCTFSVSITGISAGAQVNTTSTVSSTEGGTGGAATDTITVVAAPTTTKVFNPTTIAVGGTSTMTITITNPSATVGLTGVGFTDTFPANLVVANPNGLSNTCNGTPTATAGSGTVSLTGGTIAANSSCAVTVNVTSSVSGIYLNSTGPISSTEGGAGAAATATLTVASPPTISKSFSPKTIPVGGNSTLSFTLTNPNSNLSLSGVSVTDTLPGGIKLASTAVTGSCGSGTITATINNPPGSPSTVSLSGGTLATSGSCTFSVGVTGISAGSQVNTTGNVSSTEGGTGGTASDTLTVNSATTSTAVSSSANPSVFGQSITFTATVTDTSAGSIAQPTGSVQFVVDGVNFGAPVALTGASSTTSTATSAATATLSVSGSPHTVTANYVNADGNFVNSSNSLSGGQTVTQATTNTAVVSSSNPSLFGQSVTFTATVTDTSAGSTAQPTGAVQFVVDGVNFGSPVTLTGASSNSSTATSSATAGLSIAGSPHSVTANYVNADGNFSNSTNSLPGGQVVTKANTTTTVSSSQGTITLGDTVTFTATVIVNPPASGTPTGLVTFFDGATPIASGTLNGSAQATFSTSLLAVGSNSITAIYSGNATLNASPLSSPTTETVNLRGSTTGVALNPTTVAAGQASTITATVTDGGASNPPGTPDVFSATGAPATGRTGFISTLFADGQVLVAGGTDANNVVLKSAEIYSVSGAAFTATGNLNTARTGAVAVLLPNGKVLVAGGSSNGGANGALNSAELFDPGAGTFTPTSHTMTAARFGTTATVLNTGKVLLAGGANSGGVLNSAELYDPATDTFTATGNLNAARTGASATLLGTGKVLVAGGSSNGSASGALNSAELFDPAGNGGAGTFTSVAGANPTLSTGRWQPEAALLLSGKVLIAGGQNSGGVLTTADLYDPAADSFTASAHQMNEARANGSAVALPNGMVLLPGGTTSQIVDLYDADNDKFNTTGSLLHFDNGLVSTLLNNGRVLVVGLPSNLETSPPPSDAELYSPSFNPLGTVGFSSSEPTDVFGPACVLTPSTSTASTCTSTVTPIQVATSPHTITGTYPADAVHSGSSNSASLTVIPTAPPTIAKAFSAVNVAQNGKVNVSFTIVNPNPAATLTGISFTDALPAGLVVATPNNLNSNCGGTVTAVAGSSSISLTGGTVAPAGPPPPIARKKASQRQTAGPNTPASGQCVITVDLLVTGTGTISNTTGPVSANESGPGNPSNTATLQVVLAPTANKAFGAVTIPLNGTTSLTFNIANPNTSTGLVGVALSDTLPSGLVVANPNGLTGSCVASSVISATAGGNSISMTSLNLPASGSCSFAVNVTGTSGGAKNNTTAPITGTFDDGSGTFRVINGLAASASVAVVVPPAIAKAFVPASIAPGGVSTLSFTITNPAVNTVPENGVAFTDTLPANLVVATPNGAVGNCNGGTVTAVAGSGSISLTGGTIPASGSCVVSVNLTSATPGTYNNTSGAVTSTNGGTGNTASASLTVAHAVLSITKTHTDPFSRGQTGATYTITVSNSATAGPTIGTVTVTDTLPNGPNTLVATGLSGTGWTCTLGTLTCTRSDSLAAGASYPAITLTVNVPGNIRANVTNSATVSGGGDPNSHTANDPTHIGPPIQLTFANGTATVTRGQSASFVFTLDSSPGLGAVIFSCGGLPSGALCSFSPASSTQLTDTINMSIATSGPAASSAPMFRGGPTYALLFPALGVVGLLFLGKTGKKNRKMRLRLAMAVSGLALLLALAGCGGRPGFAGTPPGTYTITVTGTSGAASGSATVTLTVQ